MACLDNDPASRDYFPPFLPAIYRSRPLMSFCFGQGNRYYVKKADIKEAFVAIPGVQRVLWLPFGRVKDFQVNDEVTLVGCHVAVLLFPIVVQVGSLAQFSLFQFSQVTSVPRPREVYVHVSL